MNETWKKRIEDWFADKETQLVCDIARLVEIRSVKGEAGEGCPFGPGPAAALSEALELCKEKGMLVTDYDHYVGTADLNDKKTIVNILGHLDVVDEGTGWTVTEPYTPKIVDGMLYGRGTDDDKGPVVAALYAMQAVKELGVPLKYNARLIMGTDEESGSEDLKHYFAKEPFAPWSFTPDASFPVTNVEKGSYKPTFTKTWEQSEALPRVTELHGGVRINVLPGEAVAVVKGIDPFTMGPLALPIAKEMEVTYGMTEIAGGTRIRCQGAAAHASTPDEGNNAITALLALLASLPLADCGSTRAIQDLADLFPHGDCYGATLGIAQKDQVSGGLSVAFSLLEMTETGLEGRFDARVPICANDENCRKVTEKAFAERGFACEGQMDAPHYTPAEGPFIQTLLECYESYTGLKGECLSTGGGTYVHDIPGGVAFGCGMPGFVSNLHGPDEHMSIADTLTAAKIFAQVLVEMCGEESTF